MRIVYILTSLGIGGAEKQVTALSERLISMGHSVAILVLKHTAEECPTSASVLRLNLRKTPHNLRRGLDFATRFVTLFRPDIVHSHTFPANIFARFLKGRLNASGLYPPLINTIHNVYEGGRVRMLAYRLTDRKADAIVAVSLAAADRFVKLGAISRSKLKVITNGIDTEQFRRSSHPHVRFDPAPESFVWLAVGRIVRAKDYPNLLRAFAAVLKRFANASLWIAGEGDSNSLALSLGNAERGLLASHQVHWLGLRHDVVDLMNSADGFVLSSSWEGMPLVIGEAMACERVVVATDAGGVRELMGEAGVVVPPANSKALAAAMLGVMEMSRLQRDKLGADARARIVAQFSLNSRVSQLERLYRSLLEADKA